jgi:hypothetical protein
MKFVKNRQTMISKIQHQGVGNLRRLLVGILLTLLILIVIYFLTSLGASNLGA